MAVLPRTSQDDRLQLAYFNLFDDCNARCNMCDCWQLPRSRRSGAHYLEALEPVLDQRPAAIRFTGGEPLLLRTLPDLVRRAADSGARVSVITNGRLLRTKASLLADSGCAEIVLSLDAVGLVHDRIRQSHGLFDRCLAGLDAIERTGMSYGVNTVVQRLGIDDLPRLGAVLFGRTRPPGWWHLIPVRDNGDLLPMQHQLAWLREAITVLQARADRHGVEMIAEPEMFGTYQPTPCEVPKFTAYVKAETGQVYGCNMLAYAAGAIGELHDTPWTSPEAKSLRDRCGEGVNTACARCDPASRSMNHVLRRLAQDHKEGAIR